MKALHEHELRNIYGEPGDRARHKVLTRLDKHALHFMSHSPFLVLATINERGQMDASPRGGSPGFVKAANDTRVVIPDQKENNRIDSLVNIAKTGQAGLLMMIPGIDETLRINGKAIVTQDPELLSLFKNEEKPPITCIVLTVEEVFLHCAKAFMRSRLWDISQHVDTESFPTMGQMLKDQLKSKEEPESREDMIERYLKNL